MAHNAPPISRERDGKVPFFGLGFDMRSLGASPRHLVQAPREEKSKKEKRDVFEPRNG